MRKLFFVLLLLSSIIGLNGQTVSLTDYRWLPIEAKGDVVGRHENAFVEHNNKFYLIGGRRNPPVNVFDPKTNSWETKRKAPADMHHFQAVSYGNAIYIVGAMFGGFPEEQPHENIWIYYVCGIKFEHTSGTTNYFDSYDLKTGQWEVLTNAPHIRDHVHAIVANDKLYVIDGRNSSVHYADNFAAFFRATVPEADYYDFKEETWFTLKEPLPVATGAGAIAKIDNNLLFMGGEGVQYQAYNETQCLDLSTGQWSQLAPMYTGRHGTSAIVHDNKIYKAAGSGNKGGGNLTSIEVFTWEHNYKKLFNGNNLDGWQIKAQKQDQGKTFWSVEDGAILCNSIGSKEHGYVWLMSEKEYGDFELRLKFRVAREHKGNSGIQARSRYDEKAVIDEKKPGWLDGPIAIQFYRKRYVGRYFCPCHRVQSV